jgi:hypothetical protein
VTSGLTLPFLTSPDPDLLQEGSLDPLGMARLAGLLADEIAPEVTARMSRVRFVTAMAVGASALEQPTDWTAADGTPAFLALEWLVVESFARTPGVSADLAAVPGIQKARRAYRAGRHVGSGDRYLAAPKVFGFHGVYKRLAIDLGVVDDRLELLPGRGTELVEAWRADQGIRAASDRRDLKRPVTEALKHGEIRLGPTSGQWRKVAHWFAPSDAGPRERRMLWRWLTTATRFASSSQVHDDLGRRLRAELVVLVRNEIEQVDHERVLLRRLLVRDQLSRELCERLEAIEAFEALARRLDDAFRLVRVLSSSRLPTPIPSDELAAHPELQALGRELPALVDAATAHLTELDLGSELEETLGVFRDAGSGAQLVDALLDHHVAVQSRKGKRPWFERLDQGILARGPGVSYDAYSARETFVHPYRLTSLRSFCRDLRPEPGW